MKTCPFCAGTNQESELICRHCGMDFPVTPDVQPVSETVETPSEGSTSTAPQPTTEAKKADAADGAEGRSGCFGALAALLLLSILFVWSMDRTPEPPSGEAVYTPASPPAVQSTTPGSSSVGAMEAVAIVFGQ
ncbi:MAG: hypothetical protein CL477_16440 [Acidobacteria bacterium]|jgi:hypothetical protein|nr:hypothetical protein [Acidobacteriota bacterium]